MRVLVSYCIERGKNKQLCDDSALIHHEVANENSGEIIIESPSWVCLCDGVGGNSGGREASLFVCHELSASKSPMGVEEIESIFTHINTDLLLHAFNSLDQKNMATTATALCFTNEDVYLAHIGNTRLYSKRGPCIQQITVDQTTYQWLIDHGQIEAAEACNKNEIRGAMGGGRQDFLSPLIVQQVFERRIPSTLFLTTDGVHEYASQDSVEDILASPASSLEKVKLICSTALGQGSDDDRSAILIELLDDHEIKELTGIHE